MDFEDSPMSPRTLRGELTAIVFWMLLNVTDNVTNGLYPILPSVANLLSELMLARGNKHKKRGGEIIPPLIFGTD